MGDVVNLNRFRKAKEKAEREAAAGTNRTKFGRSKATRERTEAAEKLAAERLAGHKLEGSPGNDEPDIA